MRETTAAQIPLCPNLQQGQVRAGLGGVAGVGAMGGGGGGGPGPESIYIYIYIYIYIFGLSFFVSTFLGLVVEILRGSISPRVPLILPPKP